MRSVEIEYSCREATTLQHIEYVKHLRSAKAGNVVVAPAPTRNARIAQDDQRVVRLRHMKATAVGDGNAIPGPRATMGNRRAVALVDEDL